MDTLAKYCRTDDPAALSFAACLLISGYIVVKCITPPNATPAKAWKNDVISIYGNSFIMLLADASAVAVILYHTAISVATPAALSLICPNPAATNQTLFTWSASTVIPMLLIVVFGPLRLGAYKNLGKNFTYGLAAPNKLITDGIYKYMQHPSYTGIIIVAMAALALFIRWDASVGCVIPGSILSYIHAIPNAPGLGVALVMFIIVPQLATRVRQEEAMLKELFGDDWVQWNAKTSRFIPGIF
ncbi:hypothetical protein VHEMI02205 [[Torrubiella] hemipterigena]|uniref:Protein-S-isoprenylcysteine O-methyltransferase n=1 Tax=[Torrubiella] hemipterigena TaxID=1531966 RepID=A0A0A1T9V0_9HYPO|nr:hypothetical protein VHEMI02205 [[Torrubiella] hemipterigena]